MQRTEGVVLPNAYTLAPVQITVIGCAHTYSCFYPEFHAYVKYFLELTVVFLELINKRPSPLERAQSPLRVFLVVSWG